jgi:Bacteriocin-protection, YdeI or OmpD-Associated/Domain of unknown function (DUF1905)
MRSMERFSAVLGGDEGERPTVELPFDAKERYGKARAPVRGRVNGVGFRTTVAVYSGVSLIGFNKGLRDRAGIEIGDEVTVELERDDEPREVELLPVLEQALAGDPAAAAAFDALSYTHRREYAEWIAQAKKEETRERRAARAVEMLKAGNRHP